MEVIFLWQPNTWKPTRVKCLYSNILWCVERQMMAIMWTRASVHSCVYPCHDWCVFTYKMKLSWLFPSICSHCVPFLMNSLKSNAAHCDTGPIKAGERIREKLSRGHIYWWFLTYFVCPGLWYHLLAPAAAGRCVDGTSELPRPEVSCRPAWKTNNYLNLHIHIQEIHIILFVFIIFRPETNCQNSHPRPLNHYTVRLNRRTLLDIERSILTKSQAFTAAPPSQRSFTLEEQPAMTAVGEE